ncbi:MAG: hypothetical protein ACYCZA_03680 [Thiobacillus sp.]
MNKRLLFVVCALPLAFAQAQAGGLTAEPAATAYWEIPLGTTRAGTEQQAFGFRMDHVVHVNQGSTFSLATRAPVVDFRFNALGMQGIYMRGINMANPAIMKLGVEEAVLWIVGGAVLGATALIVDAQSHGGSSCTAPVVALNVGCGGIGFAGYGFEY